MKNVLIALLIVSLAVLGYFHYETLQENKALKKDSIKLKEVYTYNEKIHDKFDLEIMPLVEKLPLDQRGEKYEEMKDILELTTMYNSNSEWFQLEKTRILNCIEKDHSRVLDFLKTVSGHAPAGIYGTYDPYFSFPPPLPGETF